MDQVLGSTPIAQKTGGGDRCVDGFLAPNPLKFPSPWPLARQAKWVDRVNDPVNDEELKSVRWSVKRGVPFGGGTWVESTARRLELESTLRPRGRPRVRNLPARTNKDS